MIIASCPPLLQTTSVCSNMHLPDSCFMSFAISHIKCYLTKPLTFVDIEMPVNINILDLTEDLVEVSLVSEEGDHNENWEEEEGDDCFP